MSSFAAPYYAALNRDVRDLDELRRLAAAGIPDEDGRLRPQMWKLLLGCVPLERSEAASSIALQRKDYCTLRDEFVLDAVALEGFVQEVHRVSGTGKEEGDGSPSLMGREARRRSGRAASGDGAGADGVGGGAPAIGGDDVGDGDALRAASRRVELLAMLTGGDADASDRPTAGVVPPVGAAAAPRGTTDAVAAEGAKPAASASGGDGTETDRPLLAPISIEPPAAAADTDTAGGGGGLALFDTDSPLHKTRPLSKRRLSGLFGSGSASPATPPAPPEGEEGGGTHVTAQAGASETETGGTAVPAAPAAPSPSAAAEVHATDEGEAEKGAAGESTAAAVEADAGAGAAGPTSVHHEAEAGSSAADGTAAGADASTADACGAAAVEAAAGGATAPGAAAAGAAGAGAGAGAGAEAKTGMADGMSTSLGRARSLSAGVEREVAADNPLSLEEDSTWHKFIRDESLRETIAKDVERTNSALHFFQGPRMKILHRILFLYAKLNPGVKYVQGMNELLAPLFYVVFSDTTPGLTLDDKEADVFFCFMALMSRIRDVFIRSMDTTNTGIRGILDALNDMLKRRDRQLWIHLARMRLVPDMYAVRWLTTMLSREFSLPDTLDLWDALFSDSDLRQALLCCCTAMLRLERERLLAGDFATCVKTLQNFPIIDIRRLLLEAAEVQQKEDDGVTEVLSPTGTPRKKKNFRSFVRRLGAPVRSIGLGLHGIGQKGRRGSANVKGASSSRQAARPRAATVGASIGAVRRSGSRVTGAVSSLSRGIRRLSRVVKKH